MKKVILGIVAAAVLAIGVQTISPNATQVAATDPFDPMAAQITNV